MALLKVKNLKRHITRSSEASLKFTNSARSLTELDDLNGQTKFDEAEKLGFFRIPVKKVQQLREFVLVRATTECYSLRKAVTDYRECRKCCILQDQA